MGAFSSAPRPLLLIDGLPGTGKTVLCRKLTALGYDSHEQTLCTQLISLFRADNVKYAFALQITALNHRRKLLENALDSARPAALDCSIVGDYAFALWNTACGNMRIDDWQVYRSAAFANEHPLNELRRARTLTNRPICLLYLRDNPEHCLQRTNDCHTDETLDEQYMLGLQASYDVCFAHIQYAPPVNCFIYQCSWNVYSSVGCSAAFDEKFGDMLRQPPCPPKFAELAQQSISLVQNDTARTFLLQELSAISD